MQNPVSRISRASVEIVDRMDNAFIQFITYYFLAGMIFTIMKRLLGGGAGALVAVGFALPLLSYRAFPAFIFLFRTKAKPVCFTILLLTMFYFMSAIHGVPLNIITRYYIWGIFNILLGWSVFSINNLENLYENMVRISKWLMLLGTFIIFVNKEDVVYSMFYSYTLSLALYFHTNEFLNGKLKYVPCILFELGLILLFGSRGPILCYSVYLLAKLYLKIKNPIPKLILPIVSLLFILNYQDIGNLLEHLNIHSRSLDLFFHNLQYVSGRDLLHVTAKELVAQKPVLGWGLAGEYKVMDIYPHNIILEMQLDFGVIIGTVLFVSLVIAILYTFFKSKGIKNSLFIIWVSYGFIELFFSGSYLVSAGFYLMLGLMFNLRRQRREHRIVSTTFSK